LVRLRHTGRERRVKVRGRPPAYFGYSKSNPSALKLRMSRRPPSETSSGSSCGKMLLISSGATTKSGSELVERCQVSSNRPEAAHQILSLMQMQ
jgi:hypothetical protein